LIEIFEFLVSEGHRELDLWDHSPEKLELLAELAWTRKSRASAIEDVRTMTAIQAAVASVMTDKGQQHFKSVLKELLVSAGINQTPKQARAELKNRLKAIGATIR
jgi:hypothetical protein